MLDKDMCEYCIHIFKICDSICETFQLKYVAPAYWVKSTKSGEYVGVIYFKQLEGFVGGAYVITYSKYVNTIVIRTYPYQAF